MDVSVIMAYIILGTGLFLTVKLRFFQFTHLGRAIRGVFRSGGGSGISPFQAMATALGSSIGTANIAGVAGALTIGGPGAIFWMWIAALFGMATKAAEIILAMRFRDTGKSPPVGGPMLYIERGLGRKARPLALAFALSGIAASLVGTALVQSNTAAQSAYGMALSLGLPVKRGAVLIAAGLLACALTGAVILGGARRIGRFSEKAVPVMAAVYIGAALFAIIARRARLILALREIFASAFGVRQLAGGAGGAAVRSALSVGVARGVYSNEAGTGSSPMAHAGSSQTDPVRQSLMGIFEVFADTIVMCSLTALVILTSDAWTEGGMSGMLLALYAFGETFGDAAASVFLSAAVTIFAFTSLVGWSLYGERCAAYVFGERSIPVFRALYLVLIPLGALAGTDAVWKTGVTLTCLMALPNLAALLLLSGTAKKEVEHYKMFEKTPRRGYNKG